MKNPLCNEVLLIQPLTAEVDGLYSWFIFNCVLNIFLSVTAIIFNVVTIQALRRTLSLPETLKTLLMSLAVSDLGVGFLVQPLLVVLLFNWFRMSVENSSTCAVYTAYTLFGTLHSSASFFGVMLTDFWPFTFISDIRNFWLLGVLFSLWLYCGYFVQFFL